MQQPTTTKEASVYTTPNTDTMQGRQLDGLLRSNSRKARMLVTVDITLANGSPAYHQVLRLKAWAGRDGHKMLSLDLNDGDWAAGTYATKVCHVDTTDGTLRPAKGMTDKALLYAANAALLWAFTGREPERTAKGSTVAVQAATLCGCCGRQLTHPVSLDLGIGPECAKGLGLEHHYTGSKVLGTERKRAATRAAPKPEPVQVQPPRNTVDASKDRAEGNELQDAVQALQASARNARGTSQDATVGRSDMDIFGAPLAPAGYPQDELQVELAALRQAEADTQRATYARDAALRAGNYHAAQQQDDLRDTYQGMASGMRAELQARGVVVPA